MKLAGKKGVSRGVAQYLSRYACPETAIVQSVSTRYEAVVVVPAYREASDFLSQFSNAIAGADGRILCIVVVNAAAHGQSTSWPENSALLGQLREDSAQQLSESPPAWLSSFDKCFAAEGLKGQADILAVDRARDGHCLPEGEGVGLARKIGCDMAVQLWANGLLKQPWLYCTDADAQLPSAYFCRRQRWDTSAAALVASFHHKAGCEGHAVDEATALYEVQLRYYVLSLLHAGSPYAYHSIGSTIAVHAESYCTVRGFPRRLAGEDFHLLNKLAKVGTILCPDSLVSDPIARPRDLSSPVIGLSSRTSNRTVHGTGVAVARLLAEEQRDQHCFYSPETFEYLAQWLQCMDEYSIHRSMTIVRKQLSGTGMSELSGALRALGALEVLERAAAATRSPKALKRRLHEWFDALKTLRLVHLLQAAGYRPMSWRAALARSSWCTTGLEKSSPGELCRALAGLEQTRPGERGVSPYLIRNAGA